VGLKLASIFKIYRQNLQRWIQPFACMYLHLQPFIFDVKSLTPYSKSSALVMTERRLGRGLKSARLCCRLEEDRTNDVSALLATYLWIALTGTTEFVAVGGLVVAVCGREFRWRLHRKAPRWVDGEHIHILFCCWTGRAAGFADGANRNAVAGVETEPEDERSMRVQVGVGESQRWKPDDEAPLINVDEAIDAAIVELE